MSHLKLITHTGPIEFTKEACIKQVENWKMYIQADNAAKWIFWKLVFDAKYSERKAKKETIKILTEGSLQPIDVRYTV